MINVILLETVKRTEIHFFHFYIFFYKKNIGELDFEADNKPECLLT